MEKFNNIDDFNRGVALIFNFLYLHFPIPYDLRVTELDEHHDLSPHDKERHDKRLVIYSAALVFLKEEGFIRYSGRSMDELSFIDMTLTSKGLAALQKSPQQLLTKQSKTIAETLSGLSSDILKNTAKDSINNAISAILS